MDLKEFVCLLQSKNNVLILDGIMKAVNIKMFFYQAEKEFSAYNFEFANTENLLKNV